MISSDRQGCNKRTVIAISALLLFSSLPRSREPARIIRVISGDTLTIQYNSRWEELKLLGIEAPDITVNNKTYEKALEKSTTPEEIIRQGRKAHSFLRGIVGYGSQVWIEFDVQQRDRVGRLLGYVYLPSGSMLNEIMLQEGYADIANYPPNLRYQDRFSIACRQARENKKGFWKETEPLPAPKK